MPNCLNQNLSTLIMMGTNVIKRMRLLLAKAALEMSPHRPHRASPQHCYSCHWSALAIPILSLNVAHSLGPTNLTIPTRFLHHVYSHPIIPMLQNRSLPHTRNILYSLPTSKTLPFARNTGTTTQAFSLLVFPPNLMRNLTRIASGNASNCVFVQFQVSVHYLLSSDHIQDA